MPSGGRLGLRRKRHAHRRTEDGQNAGRVARNVSLEPSEFLFGILVQQNVLCRIQKRYVERGTVVSKLITIYIIRSISNVKLCKFTTAVSDLEIRITYSVVRSISIIHT